MADEKVTNAVREGTSCPPSSSFPSSSSSPSPSPSPSPSASFPSPSSESLPDVRIAVVGNVDAGKSSLIGVLTSGQLDNGRGGARSFITHIPHEIQSGRTSTISHHFVGVNGQQQFIHQTAPATASSQVKTAAAAKLISQSSKCLQFTDLCGHEKYLKSTISGLTSPVDMVVILINSLAGITKMTREHLGVTLALSLPFCIVVTKTDLAPANVLSDTRHQLFRALKSPAVGKMPVEVRNDKDVNMALENVGGRICPVFFISSVAGTGLNILKAYLAGLKPRSREIDIFPRIDHDEKKERTALASASLSSPSPSSAPASPSPTSPEFAIDETFSPIGVGLVVSGTVTRGVIVPDATLLLGPFSNGEFKSIYVRSVHCKRVNVSIAAVGDSAALSIRLIGKNKEGLQRHHIRRGMYIISPDLQPRASLYFQAEISILHHSTTIREGYAAIIHAGPIRQTATLAKCEGAFLRTGDRAPVIFKFGLRPEYLHLNTLFVFREGNTKGIGRITRVSFSDEEINQLNIRTERRRHHKKKRFDSAIGIEGGAAGEKEGENYNYTEKEKADMERSLRNIIEKQEK